jgi:predicted transcriptional regulator
MTALPVTDPQHDDSDAAEAKAAAIARGRADVAAGRVIKHEDMVKWLRSWGTPDELPPPSTWK